MSCPANKDGQHNYVMKTVNAPGGTVVYRECILCGDRG